MCSEKTFQTATYKLPFSQNDCSATHSAIKGTGSSLSEAFLIRNIYWFCYLRWIVVVILILFGILGQSDEIMRMIGINAPGFWPFFAAGFLFAVNIVFIYHVRWLQSTGKSHSILISLWCQIIIDLIVLTIVVYYLGGVETFIPFAYMFHIVLACVFFSRRQSLIVTLIAIVLFAACVFGEQYGIVNHKAVFVDSIPLDDFRSTMIFLSAITIWLIVWFLVAHLSGLVRKREAELLDTNNRLVAARTERARHMLTTTHQLKSPFAAIHANAQLLQKGYCGDLPEEAKQVVMRISARCRRLAGEIQDMLQLANLSSAVQQSPMWIKVNLAELIEWSVKHIQPLADERGVIFETDLHSVIIPGVEDPLKMLFDNLLSNSVAYSYEDGHVRVSCNNDVSGLPVVTISDNGIGIPGEKLPHIFDEHYRTKEAMKHNKESSGLGLAIVKHVAELHRIQLHVKSQQGVGTTFELRFPAMKQDSKNEKDN